MPWRGVSIQRHAALTDLLLLLLRIPTSVSAFSALQYRRRVWKDQNHVNDAPSSGSI